MKLITTYGNYTLYETEETKKLNERANKIGMACYYATYCGQNADRATAPCTYFLLSDEHLVLQHTSLDRIRMNIDMQIEYKKAGI